MSSSTNTEANTNIEEGNQTTKKATNWTMALVSCLISAIGNIAGPLLVRLYFVHGGKRKWLETTLQTGGFPILFIPLAFIFSRSLKRGIPLSKLLMEPKLFILSGILGCTLGAGGFCYSTGVSYLPVSSVSILLATQLAFTAFFAWLMVKQKFTHYSINAVMLMTIGSLLLGVSSKGDRPVGVSRSQYLVGFLLTLASAAMTGLLWPAIELSYRKSRKPVNYTIVLQFQINFGLFATVVGLVGMLASKDVPAIKREATEFGIGQGMYYTLIFLTTVMWQMTYIGALGLIFYTSSLLNGIVITVLLPITEVASVFAFHESFNGEKGISLALCIWGFISYLYGEYKMTKKLEQAVQE